MNPKCLVFSFFEQHKNFFTDKSFFYSTYIHQYTLIRYVEDFYDLKEFFKRFINVKITCTELAIVLWSKVDWYWNEFERIRTMMKQSIIFRYNLWWRFRLVCFEPWIRSLRDVWRWSVDQWTSKIIQIFTFTLWSRKSFLGRRKTTMMKKIFVVFIFERFFSTQRSATVDFVTVIFVTISDLFIGTANEAVNVNTRMLSIGAVVRRWFIEWPRKAS